jgi:hypothetical protein
LTEARTPWRKFDRGVVLRFFGAWLALTAAGMIVVIGGGIALWLAETYILPDPTPADVSDDMPPFFYLIFAGAGVVGSLFLGWPFALLRGRIVGPRFPFLRKGYLAVMALALIPTVPHLLYGEWSGLLIAVLLQAPMLAMTALYLVFSFAFGLFGADSTPIWRWAVWRRRMGTLDERTEN